MPKGEQSLAMRVAAEVHFVEVGVGRNVGEVRSIAVQCVALLGVRLG